jgi:hypothetical protein
MDVEFMFSDSLEVSHANGFLEISSTTSFLQAVRPKLVIYKTIEEAAVAVDEMFNLAFQSSGSGSSSRESICCVFTSFLQWLLVTTAVKTVEMKVIDQQKRRKTKLMVVAQSRL